VYTPLSFAFRKLKVKGIVLSLMITFLISGIWHGASLTYLAWGVLQGLYLSAEALSTKQKANIERRYKLGGKGWYIFLSCVFTFILFAISQVFARAADISDALLVFSKIVSGGGALFIGVPSIFIFGLLGIALMMLSDFREEFLPGRFLLFENKNKPVRILAYSVTIILILMIGVFDGGEFIYFQF
jgi:D-alanyl-lipoteichoic acid acyltransferase DltB (MBOAT superfamily)